MKSDGDATQARNLRTGLPVWLAHRVRDAAHLPSDLREFVFRFNRRHSRSRGMLFYRVLELAVVHAPVRYKDLVAAQRPRAVPPMPPRRRGHPPSLEMPAQDRPWRRETNSG